MMMDSSADGGAKKMGRTSSSIIPPSPSSQIAADYSNSKRCTMVALNGNGKCPKGKKWQWDKSKNNGHFNVMFKKCKLSEILKAVLGEISNQTASTYIKPRHSTALLLAVLLICLAQIQPTVSIRGALFRTGRSPSSAFPTASRFVGLGQFGGSDEEDPFWSLASHPARMVDLRQLLAFSQENSRSQQQQPLIRQIPKEKGVKRFSEAPVGMGQMWKSPRILAFLDMVRKQQERGEWGAAAK